VGAGTGLIETFVLISVANLVSWYVFM